MLKWEVLDAISDANPESVAQEIYLNGPIATRKVGKVDLEAFIRSFFILLFKDL